MYAGFEGGQSVSLGGKPKLARQAHLDMKDYQASVEKLRRDAAEAALIRDLATDKAKRDLYDRLHQHLNKLADEVEQAMVLSASKKA